MLFCCLPPVFLFISLGFHQKYAHLIVMMSHSQAKAFIRAVIPCAELLGGSYLQVWAIHLGGYLLDILLHLFIAHTLHAILAYSSLFSVNFALSRWISANMMAHSSPSFPLSSTSDRSMGS